MQAEDIAKNLSSKVGLKAGRDKQVPTDARTDAEKKAAAERGADPQ